ncbi:MAG: DNA polymerase III subunit gamma/tau [Alphaproteobacteria bacterium]|nr:DNA polymerase III subunit gamma/tau [Alphaproteobacteria bacterium]
MMDEVPISPPLPDQFAEPPAATPYLVLARKYRPLGFEQLIGQDVLVRTLTNAIAQNRIAHAFILTGVRGVGKTTTARIMARAFNCVGLDGMGGATISPCLKCSACQSILHDRNVDVIEMDAASHTGVDDIRDILDSSRYKPVSVRYKIYIIDEVHMLSRNAFNALLKTLEEPPEHTKFIFATTEIRKVPVTILSRCQRFDLRRVEGPILAAHFNRLAALEKVGLDAEAATLLARAADGSVRDGLSLLDQAISLSFVGINADAGNVTERSITVTADLVRTMLGLADRGQLADLFATIMAGDVKTALAQFDQLYQAGADPVQTGQDLLAFCHLAARFKFVTVTEAELDQESRRARQIGQELSVPVLTRAWQILLKGVAEIAASSDSRAALEMVLIRMAFVMDLPSPSDLLRRHQDVPNMGGSQSPEWAAAQVGAPATLRNAVSPTPSERTQHTAPPQTSFAPPPTNFDQLVALFAAHGELTLKVNLQRYCQVVEISEGNIALRAAPGLPKDFASQLSRPLIAWTGRGWQVSVTEDVAIAPPMPSQSSELSPARLPPQIPAVNRTQNNAMGLVSAAAAHPIIQAWLAAIPGAEIIRVMPLSDAENPVISPNRDIAVEFFTATSESVIGNSVINATEPGMSIENSEPDDTSNEFDAADDENSERARY